MFPLGELLAAFFTVSILLAARTGVFGDTIVAAWFVLVGIVGCRVAGDLLRSFCRGLRKLEVDCDDNNDEGLRGDCTDDLLAVASSRTSCMGFLVTCTSLPTSVSPVVAVSTGMDKSCSLVEAALVASFFVTGDGVTNEE